MTVNDTQRNLLDDLFTAVDKADVEGFLGFLTDDALFRFGSAPPVRGSESIRAAVSGFFASISACRHVVHKVLAENGTLCCEGEVTYTRHDNSEITLPFANVFEFSGDRISHYKIYIDSAPLYAQ